MKHLILQLLQELGNEVQDRVHQRLLGGPAEEKHDEHDLDMMKGRKDDIVIKDPPGFLRPQNVSSTRTAQKQYPQPTPSRNTSFETGEM